MRTAVLPMLFLLSGPVRAEATGRVVGPDGAAIRGAEVCAYVEGTSELCATTDAAGVYRVEKPAAPTLLVRANGYVSRRVDAAPLTAPVELQRAAILEVTVVDAVTRKPVPAGRVMLDSPSGRRIGTFVPFNARGVRISTLDPGDVFVRVEAEGYDPSGPVPVSLVSGSKKTLQVPLTKSTVGGR